MNIGFQKKLTFGFTAISLFSMATCGIVSYYFTASIVRDLTIHNLQDQLKGVESAILVSSADNLEHQEKLMDYWSKRVAGQIEFHDQELMPVTAENQVTHEKMNARMPTIYINGRKLANQNDWVDQIGDETGEAVTLFSRFEGGFYRVSTTVKRNDGSRNVGTYVAAGSPPYEALVKGKRFVGRAQVAGAWYITAYEPLFKDGKVVGSFFMGWPETSYGKIKDYLRDKHLLNTGYFFILDSSGQMVLHPTLKDKNVLDVEDADGRKIFSEVIAKKSGQISYRWLDPVTQKVQSKLALFRYFPQMDWYVSASVVEDEALATVARLKWILFFLSAGMTLAMAIVTIVFGRQVVKRLNEISHGLVSSEEQVQHHSQALTEVSSALASASSEQASSLQQTVSAVDEIRAMVAKNLEGTSLTENLSREMSDAAEGGQNVLTQMNERVLKIAEANRLLQSEMQSSYEKFESIFTVIVGIGQKTKVINEIVFQTKLLSFNASVEAARAGEQGKGFSVVAEEVGRLATLSGAAAAEINNTLEASKTQVKAIIDQVRTRSAELLADSEVQIKAGVAVADQCRTSFAEILEQSSKTHNAISSISIASREQSQGIDEINKAMQQMDRITQQNSTAAQKANSLAELLRNDSVQTGELVDALGTFMKGAQNHKTAA